MAIILLPVGLIDFDPLMVCLWCKSLLRIVFVLLSIRTRICVACGLNRLHPMDSLSFHRTPNNLRLSVDAVTMNITGSYPRAREFLIINILSLVCLTAGPYPLPKRICHRVRCSASSYLLHGAESFLRS